MQNHLSAVRNITKLLDNQINIFGFRFGIDPILGVIPWFGDVISFILSLYTIWIALRLGMPQDRINKMISHIVLDLVMGIIPIIGDVADFIFKANLKNLKMLEDFLVEINYVEGSIINDTPRKLKPTL